MFDWGSILTSPILPLPDFTRHTIESLGDTRTQRDITVLQKAHSERERKMERVVVSAICLFITRGEGTMIHDRTGADVFRSVHRAPRSRARLSPRRPPPCTAQGTSALDVGRGLAVPFYDPYSLTVDVRRKFLSSRHPRFLLCWHPVLAVPRCPFSSLTHARSRNMETGTQSIESRWSTRRR